MKVLIAPNALKGSLSAKDAADVIAHSLPAHWDPVLSPIADGGDGTLECLVDATGGEFFTDTITGPYRGHAVNARWGSLGTEKAAIIEMAEASGLRLLRPEQYSAGRTTTYGVGELIVKALNAGYRKILIGLGGSATNDGGAGCVQALGVRLRDANGIELEPGGIHLSRLSTVDRSHFDRRIADSTIVGLADVNTVLTGAGGASFTFAAQKGATIEETKVLDEGLRRFSEILQTQDTVDIAGLPGGGAAGGLAAGLAAFCGAQIVPGIDFILDIIRFDEMLKECDIVLTAEGSLDGQTAKGKGIAGVAARAGKFRKPVYVFAGRVKGDRATLASHLGIAAIHEVTPSSLGDREAIVNVKQLLGESIRRFAAGFLSSYDSRDPRTRQN